MDIQLGRMQEKLVKDGSRWFAGAGTSAEVAVAPRLRIISSFTAAFMREYTQMSISDCRIKDQNGSCYSQLRTVAVRDRYKIVSIGISYLL